MPKNNNSTKIKYPVIHIEDHEKELRTPSEPISLDEINTKQFQQFVDELLISMHSEPMREGWMAAGISAVQVGVHKQIFYAYNGNSETYDIFINPTVEYLGQTQDIKIESCLSVPEVVGAVRRHERVRVTYLDREGNRQRKSFKGWNSRVIQHEYDHLQGVLFTDKIVEGYDGNEHA